MVVLTIPGRRKGIMSINILIADDEEMIRRGSGKIHKAAYRPF